MTRWPRDTLQRILAPLDSSAAPADQFRVLAASDYADLPLPACGHTRQRWQMLSEVAAHDLSLVKLFEGHADALAILQELGDPMPRVPGSTWGVWAAESPGGRVTWSALGEQRVRLHGIKHWCSGADSVSHALLTAWTTDGRGPSLVKVALRQPGIASDASTWQAVGMADSGSFSVRFDDAFGERVGAEGDYVARPGFMQGGAGIAACWFGGAVTLASALRRAAAGAGAGSSGQGALRSVALGRVDLALSQTAALLRETADWIDAEPRADASMAAWRVRQSADLCARLVLDEVGRALGATPYCRDRGFARMAADLAVYTRQSFGDGDFQSLGERVSRGAAPIWAIDA